MARDGEVVGKAGGWGDGEHVAGEVVRWPSGQVGSERTEGRAAEVNGELGRWGG